MRRLEKAHEYVSGRREVRVELRIKLMLVSVTGDAWAWIMQLCNMTIFPEQGHGLLASLTAAPSTLAAWGVRVF